MLEFLIFLSWKGDKFISSIVNFLVKLSLVTWHNSIQLSINFMKLYCELNSRSHFLFFFFFESLLLYCGPRHVDSQNIFGLQPQREPPSNPHHHLAKESCGFLHKGLWIKKIGYMQYQDWSCLQKLRITCRSETKLPLLYCLGLHHCKVSAL